MVGGIAMKTTISDIENTKLSKELDKGIDDMENGRITAHEETMNILMQQYNDYVLQDSRN